MKKEAIGIGETIEEAKENALLELGASAYDDVQFDVISLPRKKTLGIFGGAKAEVKAFIEVPEKNQPKKAAPKKEKAAKQPKQPKQTEKKNTVTTEAVVENAVPANQIDAATPAGKALNYLNNILNNLGCNNIEINVALKENGADFYISGEGLGVVIGRRGETLDSLQYLTSLSANAGNGYYRVTLNIGDYRQKREQALMGLAKRMSAQVLRNGRSRTLEPMNPYERRIIHTAVQEIEGVYSKSIGEGSGRRVVISAEKGAQKPARANTPANTEREPKRDAEIPLYGKIN
ncbi:MAG: KH domain-containing protein [Clostridia bacterium]|nr:KH domain-containing protein [Clostridia bacterium]